MKERYGQLDKQVLFTCIQTKAIEEMLELWSGLGKGHLTLTTFEGSRLFRERHAGNSLSKACLIRMKSFLTNYLERKSQQSDLPLVTGSLYFWLG